MTTPDRKAVTPWLDDALIAALGEGATTRTFPKNAVVLNEGDATDALYVIITGRVKVFIANEDGKEMILDVQGAGEYFGELTLDGGKRAASVMTMEKSKLMMVPNERFEAMLASHPAFARHVVHKLIRRIRVLTENVRGLALQNVYARFTHLLKELAVEQEGRLIVPDRLTQQDMASRIGASREMVSRILAELTKGGYVRVTGREIELLKKLPLDW